MGQEFDSIVMKHFKELADEINHLDIEISFEEIEKDIYSDDDKETKILTDTVEKEEIKKTFQLIARYSHPDKVGDKFIEEFKIALEAYKNNDIDTLEEILEVVIPNSNQTYVEKTKESSEKTIERLKDSIRKEEEQIGKIKNSDHFKIIELYNSDNNMKNLKARHTLSEYLFKTIEEKTSRLNKLKNSDIL